MSVGVVEECSTAPARAAVVGDEHEQMRLARRRAGRDVVRPLDRRRPGDRSAGVRQLQREPVGAAGGHVGERER